MPSHVSVPTAAGRRVFVSYKSDNANEAREIAEFLIANGVGVWFAEYEVLTKNYDPFGVEFDREIQGAIERCDHALVLSNRLWAASEYCLREIRAIRRRLPPHRILEIGIPLSDQSGPGLVPGAVPRIDYASCPFGEILEFLATHLGVPVTVNTRRRAVAFSLGSQRVPVRGGHFLAGSFRKMPPRQDLDRVARRHFSEFVARIDDGHVLLEVNSNPYRTVLDVDDDNELALFTRRPQVLPDDRLLYASLRKRAEVWYDRSGDEERGLHLLHWHGRPQLALTFRTRGPDHGKSEAWHRLYALVLPDRDTDSTGEIDFWFKVLVPVRSEGDGFGTLCGLAGIFDRLVDSFVYEGWDYGS